MILETINLLILILLAFFLFKTFYHFPKFNKKTILLYYILFIAIGISALAITFILAFSGALPNHYINEFDVKIINDVSLFIGVLTILLSVVGLITLLSKQLLFRTRK